MKRKRTWYSKLPAKELDRMAAAVDREFDLSELKPLTRSMRKEETAARRKKPGRPRVGLGAAKVRVSLEKGLLKAADAYAKKHAISRSELISRGLQAVLKGAA
jgi:hypothetical protein